LLDEVLLFDPGHGSMRQVANLPVPLEMAAAVNWRGLLYVLGGLAPDGPSARILEVDGEGGVRELPCHLPWPACGVAVAVGGSIYLVEDGGVVLEVVPRPRVTWRADGQQGGTWRLLEMRGSRTVQLSFRVSPDGLAWSEAAQDPAHLPPGRYLEVEATFTPAPGSYLESIHLLHD